MGLCLLVGVADSMEMICMIYRHPFTGNFLTQSTVERIYLGKTNQN